MNKSLTKSEITDILRQVSSAGEPCAFCLHSKKKTSDCKENDYDCEKCRLSESCKCKSCEKDYTNLELNTFANVTSESKKPTYRLKQRPKLPLKKDEIDMLLFVNYLRLCTRITSDRITISALEKRLRATGNWEKMLNINRLTEDVIYDLLRTLTDERYDWMVKYADANMLVIKPRSGVGIGTDKDFIAVQRDTMRKLMSRLQYDVCGLCMGEPAEMQKCEYRKMLKEIGKADFEWYEEETKTCFGKTMEWNR